MFRRFLGGVHPPQNKKPQSERSIIPVSPSSVLKVPLSQHIGAPSYPVVTVGDTVTVGQLIGEIPDGKLGAKVHSPVSGKVVSIEMLPHQSGGFSRSIVIENDGLDTFSSEINRKGRDVSDMTPDEITEAVRNAGIVGMGGAGFPTAVKIDSCHGKRINWCIANGCECEPYLCCDNRVMIEHTQKVLEGLLLLSRAVGAKKTAIAIENNKQQAIKLMRKAVADMNADILVCELPTKYPQGGEKQLVYSVTKKHIPSGKLPADVGAAVFNVSSCAAVYEACKYNMPLITSTVTVAGSCIRSPENFEVRVGTPFSVLKEKCGGFCEEPKKIISGGPMTGAAISSLENTAVTKTTTGMITFTEAETDMEYNGECIRCGSCTRACPMGLTPNSLAIYSANERVDMLRKLCITDCIECGCCAYSCPAGVPLLALLRAGKSRVAIDNAEKKSKK